MAYCLALPPKDSLPALQADASRKIIFDHILVSNLEDWSEQYEIELGVFQVYYQKDPQLRVVLDGTEKGKVIKNPRVPWINGYLHSEAESHKAKIMYCSTVLHEVTMIIVNNGTAIIPQPFTEKDRNDFVIGSLSYKIAELFDGMFTLDEYIEIARKKMQSEGRNLRISDYNSLTRI